MGQTVSVRDPLFDARRVWAAVHVAAIALLMLALLALLSTGTLAEDEAWGTLEMADVPMGTPVDVVGDIATFRVYVHWGNMIADDPVLLIIEPLHEGWTYQVEEGSPTGSGFLVSEEGLLEVTVKVPEGTETGIHYIEPRLDHSTEARTLASLPVYLNVPTYSMVPIMRSYPAPPAIPGQRLRWNMAVETSVPIDRLGKLELVIAPRGWQVHILWRSALIIEGVSEPVSFSVTVGEDALPGDYAVMFSVSTSDPRVMDHRTMVTLTVESVMGFAPGDGDLHLVAALGEVTAGLITVVNEGNVPTTILGAVPTSYDDLPHGWDMVTPDLPLTIPPFTKATFNAGVRLPDDPVWSPSGGHHIPLRLLTDRGVVDLGHGLQVFVPEVRTMGIEVQGTWHLTGTTNSEMSMRLLVRDAGNLMLDRAVWLTFEGGPAITYIEVSEPSFTMLSGTIVPLVLTVRVDPQAAPGEHWVHLRAYDSSGLLTEVGVSIHVEQPHLSLVGDLEVNAVQDDGHYAGGEAGLYVVTGHVENGGDEDLAFVKVDVYDTSSGTPTHLGYVPIYDLPAGARRAFRFTLDRAVPGQNVVLAHVTGPGSGTGDPSTNSLESRFEAEAMAPVPEGQYVFLVFAVAIGAMAGLVAILGTEAGRFALMAFVLIPLYTRLKPAQVTDHFIRGQILGYVKANPGETYTHIRKALKLSNGTFVYHARILESQDHIRSVKDGANRRFYPAEMRIPTEVKDVELNQVQRMIYTIVMEYPGISQTRISKIVKLAPSTVNYHVNIMTKVGVIERKRSGRLSLCFVSEDTD